MYDNIKIKPSSGLFRFILMGCIDLESQNLTENLCLKLNLDSEFSGVKGKIDSHTKTNQGNKCWNRRDCVYEVKLQIHVEKIKNKMNKQKTNYFFD